MSALPTTPAEPRTQGSPDTRVSVEALRARIRAMQSTSLGPQPFPTLEVLKPLLPGGGLSPGGAYAVRGSTRLAMLLLAGPSAAGAWCGVVGMPSLGVEAAAAVGIDLGRLVLVPEPGEHLVSVAATLVDVLPVVLLAAPKGVGVAPAEAARLASRLRQRGAALVVVGCSWPGARAELEVVGNRWKGLGPGHGYLTGSETDVVVTAGGRRRTHRVLLGAMDATADSSRSAATQQSRPMRLLAG